jgi:hypothetical protein
MTPTLDEIPAGWFVCAVMRRRPRFWEWVALVSNCDPDADDRALRPVEPAGAFVPIPGKHRNRDAAWEMLEAMIATKH